MLRTKLRRIRLRRLLGSMGSEQGTESAEYTTSLSAFLTTEEDNLQKKVGERFARTLSVPKNSSLALIMSRTRPKLKAVLCFRLLYAELVRLGTSPGLFNRHGHYARSLAETWAGKHLKSSLAAVPVRSFCAPIRPDSGWKRVWNLLVFVLVVVSLVYVPLEMAFFEEETVPAMDAFMLASDGVFIVDIGLNFNTAFYRDMKLISDRKEIAGNYVRGSLTIDLVASFPYDLFSLSAHGLLRYIRIFRLLRLFRAARFHSIISRLTQSTSYSLEVAISRILAAFLLLLLCAHFVACIWHVVEGEDTTRYVMLSQYTLFQQYLRSYYWAITVLATVGYGDITADTPHQQLVSSLWMLIGAFFFSFFLSTMTSVFTGLDLKGTVIREKMDLMTVFCTNLKLPNQVKFDVLVTLRNRLSHNSLDSDEKFDMLSHLSKKLRTDLALSMHQNALQNAYFLRNQDKSFLSAIVPLLEYRHYSPFSTLYDRGTYADEIYFMGKGLISFVISPLKIPFRTMKAGNIVGEIEVIEEKPRKFTTISIANTEVFVMNRKLLSIINADFPVFMEKLVEIAGKREELCHESLIRTSHILAQLQEKQENVIVDKMLVKRQIMDEIEKLKKEIRAKRVKNVPFRELLYSLSIELFTLRAALFVRG